MLQLYPKNASESLEFDKIKLILLRNCRSTSAKKRVETMKLQSGLQIIDHTLKQTLEFKNTLDSGDYFPNDFIDSLEKELQLLGISNAALQVNELQKIRNLAHNTKNIINWFKGKQELFPSLFSIIKDINYEKDILKIITKVIDDNGLLKDDASPRLLKIRLNLDAERNQLRRTFEGVVRRLAKQGYLADISESFLNGRRTVAVQSEFKRIVKGIFHGSSDTQKTVFIEPEETIEINNLIFSLEHEEKKEIQAILIQTTTELSEFQSELSNYYRISGIFDFIRAKAVLAQEMKATLPRLSNHPGIELINAFHPLLQLQNQKTGKETVPLNLKLDRKNRILMISGPNAGGKTVSMKTVGLLTIMLQSGLLIPVDPRSEMGIFKQLMVHIGDTQSIENELSTYSAHLRDMKYFMDFGNGKTLFFIDELGSGSDPNLGGAFAEAMVEELALNKSLGIITTHYLNLKVMAGKVPGIFNGAMAFDEQNLLPLYQLIIGKPGSSYTFEIAKRTGLPNQVIQRAQELTDRGHVKLDSILHKTEKQSVRLGDKEKKLSRMIKENELLKHKYEELTDKERRRQHVEHLKLQNKIKKEELDYLKDMERKFKQIIQDWKKSENKHEVIESAEQILFKRKQIQQNASAAKKADKKYNVIGKKPEVGDLLRNTINHQVGRLLSIDDKKAVVQIGKLPFTINIKEWIVVERKRTED